MLWTYIKKTWLQNLNLNQAIENVYAEEKIQATKVKKKLFCVSIHEKK